jgi:hypothetical protein
MLDFHLELNGKSARVGLHGLPVAKPKVTIKYATGAGEISSRRMASGIRKTAVVSFDSLRDGDPELDLGLAGMRIDADDTTPAYFDASADQPQPIGDFNDVDIVFDASGSEKARRPHLKRTANLNDVHPIKVTKRISQTEALSSFAPKQSLQVVHVDGLSFDFLRDFALDLIAKNEAAILGAGPKGNLPIVLRNHGTPYRGFLVALSANAEAYQLLLLLSDQELKLPEAKVAAEKAS